MELVPSSTEAAAMGEVCGLFFALFSLFPNSGAVMTLAYGTELVSYLWRYMERCNSVHEWPIISLQHKIDEEINPGMELDGLLLPLSVFCPVYRSVLARISYCKCSLTYFLFVYITYACFNFAF
jgi:hypothetical protein